ncbi:MAG: hypothetical protein K9J16_09555 [Melioribacteraceae bacterium]|nr:hypothetical protein [Melioribacteraceae bacterium]MCF8355401.1 hypothetical protein [Melioribacteraceae bacterium]MCF8394646.1 hypothetical protein [Melioribacteraceae bacterium]MCF8419643.1 hypothetical protein [Melioribacteraceae bacterium]
MIITKKILKTIPSIFVVLIFAINILLIFQSEIKADYPAEYGWWGTSSSCEPGTIVTWNCYGGTPIECIVGETGKGFCPDH